MRELIQLICARQFHLFLYFFYMIFYIFVYLSYFSFLLSVCSWIWFIADSNPPYIPSAQIPDLMPEVERYEPRSALDGGDDGLCWYREIFRWAPAKLRSGGRLLFEIGDGEQGEQLTGIAPSSLEFNGIFHDMSCKPRAVSWLRV